MIEQPPAALKAFILSIFAGHDGETLVAHSEPFRKIFFDRDLVVVVLVLGEVDQAESAATNKFRDSIAVKHGTDRQAVSRSGGHAVAGGLGALGGIAAYDTRKARRRWGRALYAEDIMIRSMTAFAREQERAEHGELVWEIRSVNHRYLEATVRMPEDLRAIEPVVRERVSARLGRGKVECNLRFRVAPSGASELKINDALVDQILVAADKMAHRLHSSHSPNIMDVLRWPGVLEDDQQDWTPVQEAALSLLDKALDALVGHREREGARLAELIAQRATALRDQVVLARERMPQVVSALRERLTTRLREVVENLDQERLEQEMALLAQRLDVDEEMDRLNTHLDEVDRVLQQDAPVGRRLDFLMQELNREANTLGSKSADGATSAVSVEMKVLIEQMREQVQNIE